MVSPPAVISLLYLVHDHHGLVVVLSNTDKHGQAEIIGDRQAIADRLCALLDSCSLKVSKTNRFVSRSVEYNGQLFAISPDAVRAVLLGMPKIDDMLPVLDALFRKRYVIAEQSKDTGAIIVRKMGLAFRSFDPDWYDGVVGRRMEDYSDSAYGQWVTGAYNKAFAETITRYDEIDAFVDWPRSKSVRSRYKRLMVPVQRSDGRRLAVVATASDSSINLRV